MIVSSLLDYELIKKLYEHHKFYKKLLHYKITELMPKY